MLFFLHQIVTIESSSNQSFPPLSSTPSPCDQTTTTTEKSDDETTSTTTEKKSTSSSFFDFPGLLPKKSMTATSATSTTTRASRKRRQVKDLPPFNEWTKQIREKLGSGNKKSIDEIFNSGSVLGRARITTTEAPTTTTTSTTVRYDLVKPPSAHQAHTDTRKYLPLHDGESHPSIPIIDSDPPINIFRPSPSAFKTTNFESLVGEASDVDVANFHSQPDCDCDSAQLEELLRQLDHEHNQYRENLAQLYEAYKAQINQLNSERASTIQLDANLCNDANFARANPAAASTFCRENSIKEEVAAVADADDSPKVPIMPNVFKDQSMTFADYANLVQSPNGNQETVSNIHDEEIVNSEQNLENVAMMENSRSLLLKNLKDIAESRGNSDTEKNLQAVNLQNNLELAAKSLMAQKVLALNKIMTNIKAAALKNNLTFKIKNL